MTKSKKAKEGIHWDKPDGLHPLFNTLASLIPSNVINERVAIFKFLKAGGHYPKCWMKKSALNYAKRKLSLTK